MNSGGAPCHGSTNELFAWLAAARPLIEGGHVQYLPQYGETLGRWNYRGLTLPDLPQPYSDGAIVTREALVTEAFANLYIDQLVSTQLRAIHVLPSMRSGDIAIPNLQRIDTQDTPLDYTLLRVRIPYIHDIRYAELAKIKEDEADTFAAFKNGVERALAVLRRDAGTRK